MKTRTKHHIVGAISASALVVGLLAISQTVNAGIQNTRHNLGSGQLTSGATTGTRTALDGSTGMGDVFVLKTNEICVFCHTPHGSNTQVDVPLWNKGSLASTVYTTYASGTMNSTAPTNLAGHMSLACLSCHDGTQAMDNMVNQPGRGGFNRTTGNYLSGARLGNDVRYSAGGNTITAQGWYSGTNDLTSTKTNYNDDDTSNGQLMSAAGVDFIGTDLSNDHPIGMAYCGGGQTGVGSNTGCNDMAFKGAITGLGGQFEVGTSAAGNSTNMRLYGTATASATVECSSCHDPHTDAIATFLRRSNAGSAVCLTCHVK